MAANANLLGNGLQLPSRNFGAEGQFWVVMQTL